MIAYTARIVDRPSGRFLFTAPGVQSPERLGLVTAEAMAKLVSRDGHRRTDLELRISASGPEGQRPLSASEAAAMTTAVEQFAEGALAT